MKYVLEIKLKSLPRMTNSLASASWRTRFGHSKIWKRKVWAATWHLRPPTPLQKAKLTLTRHSSREPDFDGLVSSFKHIIDGLIEAGVLANDKSENIGKPTYNWVKTGPSHGCITIKVEDDGSP